MSKARLVITAVITGSRSQGGQAWMPGRRHPHIYVADFQYSGNLAVITRESVVTHR